MRSTALLLAFIGVAFVVDSAVASESAGRTSRRRLVPAIPVRSPQPSYDDQYEESYGEDGSCDECCDECGGRRRGCRFGCHGGGGLGADADSFNCTCNGSYKFPVPPLFTYHWPGMYSHQLMTDYHSPWRFPGIRPYRDEKPFQAAEIPNKLRQASHVEARSTARVLGESESLSAKMRRVYGQ